MELNSFENVYINGGNGPKFDMDSIERIIKAEPLEVLAQSSAFKIVNAEIESTEIVLKIIGINAGSVPNITREVCALQMLSNSPSDISLIVQYHGYVTCRAENNIAIMFAFIDGPTLENWINRPMHSNPTIAGPGEDSWFLR
jgi:serine/threonine protein kinase